MYCILLQECWQHILRYTEWRTCLHWHRRAHRPDAGCSRQVSLPAALVLWQTQVDTDSECKHFSSFGFWAFWLTETCSYLEQLASITSSCTRLGKLKSGPVWGRSFSSSAGGLPMPLSSVETVRAFWPSDHYCVSSQRSRTHIKTF